MKTSFILKPSSYPDLLRLLLGALILGLSVYFLFTSAHFFSLSKEDLGKYFTIKWILLSHITAGGIALLTGPFLLWERFRNSYWTIHRLLGRIYLVAVLISGSCAVYLSLTTSYEINRAYAFSLQVWVSVWLISSFFAYRYVIRKKFKLHKEWMMRSYIVSLAFIIGALIIKIPVVNNLGTFAEISPSIFWFSWAVPLYLYDLYLSSVRKQ